MGSGFEGLVSRAENPDSGGTKYQQNCRRVFRRSSATPPIFSSPSPPISLPLIVRRSSSLSLHFFYSADLHHLPHLIGSKQNRSSSGKWFLSSAEHLLLISSVDCRSPPPSSLD
ncbi:hypothetical protein SLEP1_g46842 [Rubroshorea leprosula]|uniref:Uncharacterized protein n=1 Tax=Rubroshorea leprosula TaxID=152421 RepID=A0AAV5LNN2_9ROSI|nr:hypothetical protein SLEP1_g46842 [Rubroshorea leprosula]